MVSRDPYKPWPKSTINTVVEEHGCVRVEQTVVICIPEMHLFHVSLQSPAVLSEKRHEDGTGEYHSAWQQHFLLLNSSFDSGKLQLAHSVHPQQVIVMTE